MSTTLNTSFKEKETTEYPVALRKPPSCLRQTPHVQKILEKSEFIRFADIMVLHLVSELGTPSYYDPKIRSIVLHPQAKEPMKGVWQLLRNHVRQPIDSLVVKKNEDAMNWKNSVQTIDELYQAEQTIKSQFISMAKSIAKKTNGNVSFGPDDINATKSKESIQSKVDRIKADVQASEAYAVQRVDDGVRGTIMFKDMQSLRKGYEMLEKICTDLGISIDASDLWKIDEDYAGYLDIDVRMLLPIGNNRVIQAELQFHLDSFYDGTPHSSVSRAHKIYEIIRMIPVTGKSECGLPTGDLMDVSRLYFTAALFRSVWK